MDDVLAYTDVNRRAWDQMAARRGLRLESFSEHPSPGMYEGLGAAAEWLPATYLIRATRP